MIVPTRAFAAALLLCLTAIALPAAGANPRLVLVEAEGFAEPGGWSLDTQFIHAMGSPYLIAHGLGEPVKDATTAVKFPGPGTYQVFVRTKDWVAGWKAPGQPPGRFQVLVDGKPLTPTFGTVGADWNWQEGGVVKVDKAEAQVSLHDLTGFDGRCDAILFSDGILPEGIPSFIPPNDLKDLAAFRKQTLGLPEAPLDGGAYDVVVIGGGYAGMGSALSAARLGCKVALVQDRPVLGGNGSSEIRVWSMGGTTLGKYPKLGEIVEEFADRAANSPGTEEEFGDAKKEAIVRAERNVSLFLNHHAFAVERKEGGISAVLARDTRKGAEVRFAGKLFVDCTGHGTIGALAGADFDMAEKGHMGMSNMWKWAETDKPQSFPETPWALPLTMKDFPYPNRGKAEWFWEGGFNRHPINDLEYIRDWNLRAAYGAFNAMKNGDGAAKHANAKLEWVAYVGGNRESRLLRGDVVLSREDIVGGKDFPDASVPTTWDIDLHEPKEQFAKKFPDDPFISKAIFGKGVDKKNGYPLPYRCFYSRNVPNLFMAGRNISVNREALGTIRVMRTCGMMGEVVGKAASICTKYNCSPRDVYASHLPELIDLMQQPGRARRESVNDVVRPDAPLPYDPAVVGNPAPPHRHKEPATAPAAKGIDPKTLGGIVVDDAQAKLTGDWTVGTGLPGFIGAGYRYANPQGAKTVLARFEFAVPATGDYDVRLAYAPHENRSATVATRVESAAGGQNKTLNQQEKGTLPHGFASLGVFRFEAGKPGAVEVGNHGGTGHVAIDAVWIVPAK